jgi:HAE1 family hydrophobic/amphiphilic exporter-1
MIGFFARHPTAANLLMLIIIGLGLISLPEIKRETFPVFQAKKVNVSIVYPGANPYDVESALCVPLEDAIDGTNQVNEIQCEAREGLAIAVIEMIEKGDISRLMADVKNAIDGIDTFPEQIESPILEEQGRTDEVIHLAIQAKMNDVKLKEYAEQVKRKLKREPGISLVNVDGFSDHQLRVNISLAKLRQYGITIQDVANALSSQNLKMPSGVLKGQDKTVMLRFDQQSITATDLENTIIASSKAGGQIRLIDIAKVEDRFELQESKVIFDGERAALLKIKKTKQQDAIDLVTQVRDFIDAEAPFVPAGITMTLTNDSSSIINDRLSMLMTNGWQGILLVFAVMWLFFAWRYAFWVSMGLPVSFLGAFFLMSVFGISINMISMVAMLMAIGILMDDAIVIAESIATKVERGGDIQQGAIEGVKLVLPGVIASFLTTCAIFGGMAFIAGDIGQVLRVIPIVLLLTLVVSLIEAFLILPNHLIHSMHKSRATQKPPINLKLTFIKGFDRFRQGALVRGVEAVVKYRYLFVGSVIGLLFISVALAASGLLKFKAFPNTEGDVIEVRVLMPPGTPLATTERITNNIIRHAEAVNRDMSSKQPDSKPLIEHLTVEYNKNVDAFASGENLATIRADLLTVNERTTSLEQVKGEWRKRVGEVPGAVAVAFKEPVFGPAGRAIEIRLQGNDIQQLQQASIAIRQQLVQFNGVSDVMEDSRPGKEEFVISLKTGALALGADGNAIANQLRIAFNGAKIDDIQRGTEQIELYISLSDEDRKTTSQLHNFPIILANGSEIPLSSIANFEYARGPSRINRIEGQRTITIIGDIDAEIANTTEILAQLSATTVKHLAKILPQVDISFEGEAKEGNTTAASIVSKFGLGLLGIFVILSFQFKSYVEPIMVMLAIPLAIIGVMWGHLLLGYDLTMPSIVGFVSLAGIVVNDSILLVAYIKQHMSEGQDLHQAAVNASKERFRAVFITSATTIAGTFPLLLETSTQAQVLQPLVVSLIFGMITATCLILFVLPALYVILQDLGLASDHHLQKLENAQ